MKKVDGKWTTKSDAFMNFPKGAGPLMTGRRELKQEKGVPFRAPRHPNRSPVSHFFSGTWPFRDHRHGNGSEQKHRNLTGECPQQNPYP